MMSHRYFEKRFHVVDLDPYGTASTFLDSAVQAVADEGFRAIICCNTSYLLLFKEF